MQEHSHQEQIMVIRKITIGGGSSEEFYRESHRKVEDSAGMVMYEMLRSLVRRQMRAPFQSLKKYLAIASSASSLEGVSHHLRHDLEIIGENIRNVSSIVRQRLLLQGYASLKNYYLRGTRVQEAYYNTENLARLNMAMVFTQNAKKRHLKSEGFYRLLENLKALKLSKITISKIEVVSADLTKQLEDLNPFLTDRGRQIQAINSYIIDRSSDQDLPTHVHPPEDSQEMRDQVKDMDSHHQQSIERHFYQRDGNTHSKKQVLVKEKHSSLTEKYFTSNEKKQGEGQLKEEVPLCSQFVADSTEKRHNKKAATSYFDRRENSAQRFQLTQRKEVPRHEAVTTGLANIDKTEKHHLFLVCDYRKRSSVPTNYVKVPIASEKVKIVEVHSNRKKKNSKKQYIEKAETEVQRLICENCKFCQQAKERRWAMRVAQQRIESFNQTSAIFIDPSK